MHAGKKHKLWYHTSPLTIHREPPTLVSLTPCLIYPSCHVKTKKKLTDHPLSHWSHQPTHVGHPSSRRRRRRERPSSSSLPRPLPPLFVQIWGGYAAAYVIFFISNECTRPALLVCFWYHQLRIPSWRPTAGCPSPPGLAAPSPPHLTSPPTARLGR